MESNSIKAYYKGGSVVSNLGKDLASNWAAIKSGKSALEKYEIPRLGISTYTGAIHPQPQLNFELQNLLQGYAQQNQIDLKSNRLRVLLSTTKGNIVQDEISPSPLYEQALFLQKELQLSHVPKIISHACISGTLAIKEASEMIGLDRYDEVVIMGYDPLCDFVLAGFQSFMALAPEPCQPYDKNRKGINLGEVITLMHLSRTKENASIYIAGGGSVNDANHISGPSRDGEGLYRSIQMALSNAQLTPEAIDYVNAHGTATAFNDDMEAHAYYRAGLKNTPMHSLKSYYGHTLGAAGVLEVLLGIAMMEENYVVANNNSKDYCLPFEMNVIKENQELNINHMLKCSAGFGGCNAAIILSKEC